MAKSTAGKQARLDMGVDTDKEREGLIEELFGLEDEMDSIADKIAHLRGSRKIKKLRLSAVMVEIRKLSLGEG